MTPPAARAMPLLLAALAAVLVGCGGARHGPYRAREAEQQLSQAALPFLGVACGVPNSIVCDRVGIGVHLSQSATLVTVEIADRLITLSPPTEGSDLWLGYLYDAG